jgi:RNA-directed DNA polymerase
MPICGPARSETPNTSGNSMRENRETSSAVCQQSRPAGEGRSHTTCMNADEESDRGVVPAKVPNNTGQPVAEGPEGRPRTKENAGQAYTYPTQSGKSVSQGLAGVRKAARERKKEKFTALLHHLTVDLLKQSFQALKKRAAAGVDGVTWKEYEVGVEDRLKDLHSRVHRGAYRALPSRRVYIPKADGRQRPLGIAALEDKIVQLAMVRILECIYEEDFLGFSYGFRPGRSQHDALDAVTVGIERRNVSWVLDADIRGFFDQLNHEWLMRFIEHRVADVRMLRLIRKWLKAGVLDEGQWQETEVGTPQGAVISPLLANIYLHYVVDLWVQAWRKAAAGDVIIVRYADDFVLGFQYRGVAERFQRELEQRLRQFGLELHPDKTRLIEFGRYAATNRRRRGEGKPETFNFLGFTHISGKQRMRGHFCVIRITTGKRMHAKLKQIKEELRQRMHHAVAETGQWLQSVIRGYFRYMAVPGNGARLSAFRRQVTRLWQHALRRRSDRRPLWDRLRPLFDRWIPPVRILHPYPNVRFDARHPR